MFLRIILFLIGILLVVIGLTSIILYINLLTIGYSFIDYVNFIIRRIECISLLVQYMQILYYPFDWYVKIKIYII